MRFLKTLQKRESEQPFKNDELEGFADLDEAVVAGDNEPPGMLSFDDLRIGAPKIESDAKQGASIKRKLNEPNDGESVVTNGTAFDPISSEVFSIPKLNVNVELVNKRVVSITHPRSPYCEEYRSLRTQILQKSKRQKLQAIVVVSVGPSEGKSITALNLSWLFAQTDGVRALVIDSDLRLPSLASYLGIESKKGLSDVLTGNASLTEAIVQLEPAGLYVLPGGEPRSDVAELISGPRFAEILDEARGLFDYVIIDAPPLGIFTDAAVLINLADGALLVVRANQTRYKDIDRILDTLPRERILGTVVNQSEDTLMDESYYKYGFYDKNSKAVE